MIKLIELLFFIKVLVLVQSSPFNTTIYRQMPPLYYFEDYDACLDVDVFSKYCIVHTQVVPNASSSLWKQIETFSKDTKRHYQHQELIFGICLNRCKNLVATFDTLVKRNHYRGRVNNSLVNNYLLDIFKRDTDTRILNNQLINQCINYDFKKKYNLLLGSNIVYCVANDEQLIFDSWNITFAIIVVIIISLAFISSIYDYINKKRLKRGVNDESKSANYENEGLSPTLTSFSIIKNWNKLTDLSPKDQIYGKELQFLHCFRFITTIAVIFAHALIAIFMIPLKNPEFLEMKLHRFETIILKNGPIVIQIFLVISGFLLCIKFNEYYIEHTKESKLSMFSRFILFRYLRIMPAYAFVILFYATFFTDFQNGPFWRFLTEGDRVMCREQSWKNLLFVNNIAQERSCMHHSWYLAIDFQLLIYGIIVLLIIAKYPNMKITIMSICLIIAFLVPVFVTYINKLDAWFEFTPESYRFLFFHDPTYNQSYLPSHTNLGGYFFGIVAGFIYINCISINFKLNENKLFRTMWYLSFPFGFLMILSGQVFISYDLSKPSILMSLYSGGFKMLWGACCCVITLGMCFKVSPTVFKFCTHSIFIPLGRLGYSTFLVHVIGIKLTIGYYRDPLYISNFVILSIFIISSLLSLLLGLIVTLFIEMPMSTLLHELLKSKCDSDQDNETQKQSKSVEETIK